MSSGSGGSTVVLMRLARIERQQLHQTQLIQLILESLNGRSDDPATDLPDGVSLPVKTLSELLTLEGKLDDDNSYSKLVIGK